jgi:phospholipase/carboxylesterase
MGQDTDVLLEATMALVPPLLTALDALAHAGRHLHPQSLAHLVPQIDAFARPLRQGARKFEEIPWPPHLERFRDHISASAGEALAAMDAMSACLEQANPVLAAYQAMGAATRATERLYPVSFMLPPVSRFFLTEAGRDDGALARRLERADPGRDDVGVMHAHNGPGERGGFSLYVPEYYDAGEAWPVVVALHGGSGHGRSFLWNWLKDARSRGVLLVAPTSRDRTWSLAGSDADSASLDAIVERVCEHWRVVERRILLTGMSDGGTFSYLSGLRSDTPFTHLSPISASFHPFILEGVDRDRLTGLPIYLVHGTLDWMFPVDVARTARDALTAAGAALTYREVDDLSHTYPREENARILDWLMGPSAP